MSTLFYYKSIVFVTLISLFPSLLQSAEFYDASDAWIEKIEAVNSVDYLFEGMPNPRINFDEVIFKSLYIPKEWFTSTSYTFAPESPDDIVFVQDIRTLVGYGNYAQLKDKIFVGYSAWSAAGLNSGLGIVASYDQDVPREVYYKSGSGFSGVRVINQADDTGRLEPKGLFFPGHDEANAHMDGGDSTAELSGLSYFFDLSKLNWSLVSDEKYEAHHSSTFDWNKDGKDDLLRAGWQTGFGLWLNEGNGSFSHVPLYGSGATLDARHTDTGSIEVAIGDAAGMDNKIGPFPYNALLEFPSDITQGEMRGGYLQPLTVNRFLDPILEDDGYSTAPNNMEQYGYRSHDVSVLFVDIDHDGDEDLVMGSSIWGHVNDALQIYVYEDGNWTDETKTRLHNFHMMGMGSHSLEAIDINHDGFIDLVPSDHASAADRHVPAYANHFRGERILINDGTGHFAVVVREQVNIDSVTTGNELSTTTHVPWLSPSGLLRWTLFHTEPLTDVVEVHTRLLRRRLSTGPNGMDPAEFNEPDFNEFYYLLHNPDVRNEIESGSYVNGLDHYIKKGKSQGLATHREHPGLAKEYIFDGSGCKANQPGSSVELQSRESGLTNTSLTKTISVTCPVLNLTRDELLTRTARTDYFLSTRNESDSSKDFDCSLQEVSKGKAIMKISETRRLQNGDSGTHAWRNIRPSDDSSGMNITCSLPPNGILTQIKVRVASF